MGVRKFCVLLPRESLDSDEILAPVPVPVPADAPVGQRTRKRTRSAPTTNSTAVKKDEDTDALSLSPLKLHRTESTPQSPPLGPVAPIAVLTCAAATEAAKATTAPSLLTLRGIFHRATVPEVLVGRAEERAKIVRFIDEHLRAEKPGGLYISGSPGTGKTVLVDDILKQLSSEGLAKRATVVQMNCMALSSARAAFGAIARELLGADAMPTNDTEALDRIQERLTDATAPMALIVLDEVDHLTARDQDVLYHMFEWASLPSSRLVLIGIANALDLTDRLLPRLRAAHMEPELLHFAPCSQSDLARLLRQRLAMLANPAELTFDDFALELCARKVAANSGDIRKALDVCRRSIERAAGGLSSPPLSSTRSPSPASPPSPSSPSSSTPLPAASSPSSPLSPTQSSPATVRVTIAHVSAVITEVFGSPYVQKVRQLPLHGKLVLCSLVLLQTARRGKDTLLGEVHAAYLAVCNHRGLVGTVSRSEFHDLCSALESGGLVMIARAKEERLRKVTLCIQTDDVKFALKDDDFVLRILGDGLPPSAWKAAGL